MNSSEWTKPRTLIDSYRACSDKGTTGDRVNHCVHTAESSKQLCMSPTRWSWACPKVKLEYKKNVLLCRVLWTENHWRQWGILRRQNDAATNVTRHRQCPDTTKTCCPLCQPSWVKCEKKLCVAGQGDREGYASTIIVLGLSRRLEIFYSCHGELKLFFFNVASCKQKLSNMYMHELLFNWENKIAFSLSI